MPPIPPQLGGLPGFGPTGTDSLAGLPGFEESRTTPGEVLQQVHEQNTADLAEVEAQRQAEAAALAQQQAAKIRARQEREAEFGGFTGGLKAAGQALTEGLYAGTTALPRGLAALGYAATGSEALKDFVRETSPENLFPTISEVGAGGLSDDLRTIHSADDAATKSALNREGRRQEWANLTSVSETAGLIAGAYASSLGMGGLVGLAGRGLGLAGEGFTASEAAFGGGIARQALVSAAEGSAFGATQPFDNGGTPTQRQVLGQAFMGALINGALGGAATGVGKGLGAVGRRLEEPLESLQAKVFGRSSRVAQEQAVEDMARELVPDAPPGVAKEALDAKEFMDPLVEARRAKIEAAGPNPAKQAEAAEEATQAINRQLEDAAREHGKITEDNWEKVPAYLRTVLHDHWEEAAARDFTRTHNKLLDANQGIRDILDNAASKEAVVAKNLEGVDATQAIGKAQSELRDIRDTFEGTIGRESGIQVGKNGKLSMSPEWRQQWGKYRRQIDSLTQTFEIADNVLAETDSPAKAYMAMDQVRRQMAEKLKEFGHSALSSDPTIGLPAKQLANWAEDAYLGKLVPHLSDATTWGKQGATQAVVNEARKDMIQAATVADGGITSRVGTTVRGTGVFEANPEKARTLIGKINRHEASLTRDKMLDYYRAQERIGNAMKDGYQLAGKQLADVDALIDSAKRGQQIFQTVERQSTTTMGQLVSALLHQSIHGTSHAVGGAVGGALGGPVGALIGAVALPVIQKTAKAVVSHMATGEAGELIRETLGRGGFGSATRAAAEVAGSATETAAPTIIQKVARAKGGQQTQAAAAAPTTREPIPRLGPQFVSKFSAAGLSGRAAASELFRDTRSASRQERLEQFEKRRDAIGQLASNPGTAQQGIQAATAGQRLGTVFAGVMGAEMMQKMQTLYQNFPGRQTVSPIPSKATTVASDQDVRKANAYWEATVDPTSVFTDYANGNLDYDKVEFARKQWPDLFGLYKAAVIDELSRIPADSQIASNQLTQLDMLMDFGGALSPTVASDFSQRFDGYAKQIEAERANPRQGGNLDLPTANPTPTQRIAAGGRA